MVYCICGVQQMNDCVALRKSVAEPVADGWGRVVQAEGKFMDGKQRDECERYCRRLFRRRGICRRKNRNRSGQGSQYAGMLTCTGCQVHRFTASRVNRSAVSGGAPDSDHAAGGRCAIIARCSLSFVSFVIASLTAQRHRISTTGPARPAHSYKTIAKLLNLLTSGLSTLPLHDY